MSARGIGMNGYQSVDQVRNDMGRHAFDDQ